jgi:hypothetical protein
VPSIRARFFPASPPAIETSTSRANISARLRVTRRLFEYSDRLRFCSERESASAHVMRPIGAYNSGIDVPVRHFRPRFENRRAWLQTLFFGLEKNDARRHSRFFLSVSRHIA